MDAEVDDLMFFSTVDAIIELTAVVGKTVDVTGRTDASVDVGLGGHSSTGFEGTFDNGLEGSLPSILLKGELESSTSGISNDAVEFGSTQQEAKKKDLAHVPISLPLCSRQLLRNIHTPTCLSIVRHKGGPAFLNRIGFR